MEQRMVEYIFSFVIIAFTSLIMIVIGIAQIKSKSPVGFYTGEKPLKEEQLSDVKTWNKKHGTMWILYGVAIITANIVCCFIWETVWTAVLLIIVIVGALPIMMWYHSRLKKEYLL